MFDVVMFRRAAAAGLILAVIAGAPRAHGQAAPPIADAAGPVEVAAFANLSGDPADAWIGDGIAETLGTELGRSAGAFPPGLRVAGAYQRVGASLRITAQLVDAGSRRVVAGARVDGAMADLFDLQDDLVARLAEAVHRGMSRMLLN